MGSDIPSHTPEAVYMGSDIPSHTPEAVYTKSDAPRPGRSQPQGVVYVGSNPPRPSRSQRRPVVYIPRRSICDKTVYMLSHSDLSHIPQSRARKMFGKLAVEKDVAEIAQLLRRKTFRGVHLRNLTQDQRKQIVRSTMFSKVKFLPSGEVEKLKSRLVAGGDMQDKNLYDEGDLSSPTVSTTSVFAMAAIAQRENRKLRSFDIGGAFLHAEMKKSVVIRLNPANSRLLVDLDPSYAEFMGEDGTILLELLRALYGCIEAPMLWYEDITSKLKQWGFVVNPSDACTLNCDFQGNQLTVQIHVDDLMCSCREESGLDWLEEKLKEAYEGEVTVHTGEILDYLGMTFDYSVKGKVLITMPGYIKDLCDASGVQGTAETPASATLYEIDESSPELGPDDKVWFHSHVMKCMYLGKRVRPESLPTTSFLASRVTKSTEQDMKKLKRLIKYLQGSKQVGLCLSAAEETEVTAFIDASHGIHADGRGVTGALISLGKGAIESISSKQKINTKSSTETELVGLSDYASQVIWIRDFMIGQGYQIGPATIYQDNQSTMALIAKGRSTAPKTRHIRLRYFWLKDRVDAGEVIVRYMPTEEMVADVLTKPLQGEFFLWMRDRLLGYA